MDPTPPSKRRRSSSPSAAAAPRPSGSPSRPLLPPPTPSAHAQPGLYPTFAPPPQGAAAGPSWAGWPAERDAEAGRARAEQRRSMDARSPVSDVESTRMEFIDEGSEGGMLFARHDGSRAPRSMMACTRCRRQKMKCDGPGNLPCRGCRQSGQPCIFEARSRPKSISALPSRAPPFHPTSSSLARPGSPTPVPQPGPSMSSGFYPSHSQPAPPVTSRNHPPPSDSYIMRSAREPLPPAPPSSLSAMASSTYVARGHASSASTSAIPTGPVPPQYYNHPSHMPPVMARPISPTESRWRNVEGSLRSLQGLPSTVGAIQSSLNYIQRSTESVLSVVSARPATGQSSGRQEVRAREAAPDISDMAWNSYRSSAWPLTPWLVGLREAGGLPGLVVAFLGKRTLMDRTDQSRQDCGDATAAVYAEIARLMVARLDWTKEEIRALGVFGTWLNDTSLSCFALGQARMQGLDRIMMPRRSHDDWREWIYLSLMDKLSHVPDFIMPLSIDILSHAWRERLNTTTSIDPAVRDRDLKLLAWLEYSEYLVEILKAQQTTRLVAANEAAVSPRMEGRPSSTRPESSAQRATGEGTSSQSSKAMELWKRWGGQWENWAMAWNVRADPILSLHYNYALLFTLSPVFLCSPSVWTELASSHEGSQHLDRTRDAAFAVIKAICSPEVSRTLPFSFALFRPLLGLAVHTLVSLHIALPNSPIISPAYLVSVLRSTHETLYAAHPLDAFSAPAATIVRSPVATTTGLARPSSVRPSSRASRISTADRGSTGGTTAGAPMGGGSIPEEPGEGGLLREMVEGGIGRGRDVWGQEPGREVWRRLVG